MCIDLTGILLNKILCLFQIMLKKLFFEEVSENNFRVPGPCMKITENNEDSIDPRKKER